MPPSPIFNDKQLERIFRSKQRLVDEIIADLASRDKFWTMSRDATGKPSQSPVVKFLVAQK
jgi:hypothetical protein